MGSLGGEAGNKKTMWLYPRVLGFNPSERWGHSACCSGRAVYVFGGCCGGLHFSDVLMLDLDTMVWTSLATTGQRPGTRDSHSAVLVGHNMIILGGTNGSKKVNDLHILDLRTREWNKPQCKGNPPSPRESHTATAIGDDKLVIFGGSGEGEANYLNDVHILDLKTMTWSSPEVKGDLPAPRDSHTAVAIGNRLVIYGGDCGDRYHGEVDVLDMDTLTWSRLVVQGSTPGVRAGHAAVNIGTKVYIIGGVGDKHYYSDVWVLDVSTHSWTHLGTRGQQPQGRFSHSAVVTDLDIAIYGGCGEDERPLNELLILQLGSEHPNGRYNISMCKIFGNHWSQDRRKMLKKSENTQKSMVSRNGELNQKVHSEAEPKQLLFHDNGHAKRRKTNESKSWENESEQEEHSLSLSQHSSPSHSDQEQYNVQKLSSAAADAKLPSWQFGPLKLHQSAHKCHPDINGSNHIEQRNGMQMTNHDGQPASCSPRKLKTEQFLRVLHPAKQEFKFLAADQQQQMRPAVPPYIGAEVHGTVDGAFDSGYLMTANVNGQILRGVLFAPGPGVTGPRAALLPSSSSPASTVVVSQQKPNPTAVVPIHGARPSQHTAPFVFPDSAHHLRHAKPVPGIKSQPPRHASDLQGVVLTLGGPRNCSA